MQHGISTLSVVPLRKEPSDSSEMVTQILFGERFEIEETQKKWSRIKLEYDGYTGWIDNKQISLFDKEETDKLAGEPATVSMDIVQLVVQGKQMIPILLGSSLPFYYGKKFFIQQQEYFYEGQVKTITTPEPSQLIENAFMYFNAPYLWGGRSPFGIDCSGLTQMVFKMSGIRIKRDAWQQAEQGKKVADVPESKEGDLAFFKNDEGRVVHTGIVLSKNRIIHASGKVRIDNIDEKGIYNNDLKTHTHVLAGIRRFL